MSTPKIAVIDYGIGNLRSAEKALQHLGADAALVSDPEVIDGAAAAVLPGVGAFGACMDALDASGLAGSVRSFAASGRPFLGICVGMQLLATTGHEYSETAGLGWVPGDVVRIDAPGLKVPHIGWNDMVIDRPHPVLAGLSTGDHAYFVHSYRFQTADPAHLLAHVDYGGPVSAIVWRDNILGTQFHPEKSQTAGLRLIGNFLRWRP